MKKSKTRLNSGLAKSIRRDWRGVKPDTRVFRAQSKFTRKQNFPKKYC